MSAFRDRILAKKLSKQAQSIVQKRQRADSSNADFKGEKIIHKIPKSKSTASKLLSDRSFRDRLRANGKNLSNGKKIEDLLNVKGSNTQNHLSIRDRLKKKTNSAADAFMGFHERLNEMNRLREPSPNKKDPEKVREKVSFKTRIKEKVLENRVKSVGAFGQNLDVEVDHPLKINSPQTIAQAKDEHVSNTHSVDNLAPKSSTLNLLSLTHESESFETENLEPKPIANIELAPVKPKENLAPLDVPDASKKILKKDVASELMQELGPKKEITVLMNELSLLLPFTNGITVNELKQTLSSRQNLTDEFDIFRGGIRLSELTQLHDHSEVLQAIVRQNLRESKSIVNHMNREESNITTEFREFQNFICKVSACFVQSLVCTLPKCRAWACFETKDTLEAKIQIRNAFERGLEYPQLSGAAQAMKEDFLLNERRYLSIKLNLCSHIWRFRADLCCRITAFDLSSGEQINTEDGTQNLISKAVMNRHNMLEFDECFSSVWSMERLYRRSTALFFEIIEDQTTLIWGFLQLIDESGNVQFDDLKIQLFRPTSKSVDTKPYVLSQYIQQKFLGFDPVGSFLGIQLSSDVDPKQKSLEEAALGEEMSSKQVEKAGNDIVLFQNWNRFQTTVISKEVFEETIV